MGKIAFVYPGQGAQKIGMGKDFYENNALARQVFEKANNVLDFDIKKVCFEENDLINNTMYTQAALVTTCLAMTKAVEEKGIKPDVTAGLSLGEYAAIVAAHGMRTEDAIKSVRQRGIFMNNAVPDNKGAMAAVLGMTKEQVIDSIKYIDNVFIANYNCPAQIVITGLKEAVDIATESLKSNGAKRVLPLNVSGPFHSPFLKKAGKELGTVFEQVEFTNLNVPYVTNVTGKYVTDISQTKELLVKQVSSSVMWEQSVVEMINNGVDTFIEIGPGRTLAGFIRKIDKSVKVINISTLEDLENV